MNSCFDKKGSNSSYKRKSKVKVEHILNNLTTFYFAVLKPMFVQSE